MNSKINKTRHEQKIPIVLVSHIREPENETVSRTAGMVRSTRESSTRAAQRALNRAGIVIKWTCNRAVLNIKHAGCQLSIVD